MSSSANSVSTQRETFWLAVSYVTNLFQGNLKYSLGEHEDNYTTKDLGKDVYDTEGNNSLV